MQTNDGRLIVVGGASRSGKTAYVKKAVRGSSRLCAWDAEDQWAQLPGWKRVTTKAGLLDAITKPGAFKVAYVPGGDLQRQFDFWAGCVQYAGRYVEGLTCIAEELADVTSPAKAPGNWGILLRRGLKRGITIYAISQRWAEADKTALGNASEFVLFAQSSADDVRYLAKKTRIEQAELDALVPLQYVRYEVATRAVSRGKLKF